MEELKVSHLSDSVKLYSVYKRESNRIVLTYKISNEISYTQYERLQEQIHVYEKGRVGHVITRNIDNWVVTWSINDMECLITTDVNKEDLYKIINSIYRRNER